MQIRKHPPRQTHPAILAIQAQNLIGRRLGIYPGSGEKGNGNVQAADRLAGADGDASTTLKYRRPLRCRRKQLVVASRQATQPERAVHAAQRDPRHLAIRSTCRRHLHSAAGLPVRTGDPSGNPR